MKALNLKSMSYIMVLAMMFIVSFTSCGDDNNDSAQTGTEFPNVQEVSCNPDGTVEISFEPTADWQLASSKGWCKFVNGDFTESTMTGKAGKQTITAKVSNDGQNYSDDEVAEITLKVGDKSQVIYKITRPKKMYNGLSVKDAEGNIFTAENPIVIKGSGIDGNEIVYTSIIADAEFAVGIDSKLNPDWITVNSTEAGKFSLTFNKDNKDKLDPKYSFGIEKGYTMTFGVQTNEGLANVSIPVVYEGLKEGAFSIGTHFFNLKVSLDGKKMINASTSITGSTGQIYKDKIATTITTRNDEYQIVKFEEKGVYESEWLEGSIVYRVEDYIFENANTAWVHETKEGSEYSLTFDAFTPDPDNLKYSRSVVVMAFPKNVYDKIKDDLKGNIIEITPGEYEDEPSTPSIKYIYDTYIVAGIIQQDIKTTFETGMVTEWGYASFVSAGMGEEPLAKYEGAPIEGAGTDNIYKATFYSAETFQYSSALAIKIENGEGLTTEVKSNTVGTKIAITTPIEGLPNEEGKNDGKQYIVLTPATAHDTTIAGTIQIAVKSGNNVEALIIVEFVKASTPAPELRKLSKLKSRK